MKDDDDATPSFFLSSDVFFFQYIYVSFFFLHHGFRWYQWKPRTQGQRRHQVVWLSECVTWNYLVIVESGLGFFFPFFCFLSLLMSTWFTSSSVLLTFLTPSSLNPLDCLVCVRHPPSLKPSPSHPHSHHQPFFFFFFLLSFFFNNIAPPPLYVFGPCVLLLLL